MDTRRLVADAVEREAERLASQASSPHVAALLRYACRRAGEAADLALVIRGMEISETTNPAGLVIALAGSATEVVLRLNGEPPANTPNVARLGFTSSV